MTTTDRAAEIIERFLPPLPGSLGAMQAEKTARALADAGLLMPGLPPVTVDELDRPSATVGPASPAPGAGGETRIGRVVLDMDGRIFTTGVPNPYRSIGQARAHALAILAMCNHVEGTTDD